MANLYWPKKSHFRSEANRRRRFEAKFDKAEKQAKDVLLISHGHCLDGTGSIIVTLRALGADRVGVATCQPSDMRRVLEYLTKFEGNGRKLMIADLSLNPDQYSSIVAACKTLKDNGWTIEWRDHHHKQWEGLDLKLLLKHIDVLEVDTKAKESGASLQAHAIAPKDKFAKKLAHVIRDRDLWWNEDPDSETLEYAITRMGDKAFIAHYLRKTKDDPVVDSTIAKAAEEQKTIIARDADRILKGTRYWTAPDGRKVGIVYGWLPKNVGLHRVLEQDDVHVAVNVRPNGHMSLRSRQESPVCQEVAREFDGGGHPNASGGTLSLKGLRFWWYVLRRGQVRRVAEVAQCGVKHLQ